MKLYSRLLSCFILLAPLFALSQVPPATDSMHKTGVDSLALHDSTQLVKKDTVIAEPPKAKMDCYTEWLDAFRTRGGKPVPDGMQEVIIALKDTATCRCFMGRVEVVGGKIKPPLQFQRENGEYHPVSVVGKKLEPAFQGSMTLDELYAVKEGMSIVFRTTDNEYGRIFFYKFVNKGAQSNKEAPSPTALLKD